MTPEERATIRDTARYLRNVRPIDPEELTEYVESRPHSAVVRQVLRESAAEVGLLEREDGLFVPVPDSPLVPEFDGVDRLPERYERRLDGLLTDRFGPEWEDDESGDALRGAIRDLKERYYRGRDVAYDETAALGYALYHLQDYYAAIQYLLDELGSVGLLPSHLRVLDVGAGVGGPALGLADYAGRALIEYHAIEPSVSVGILSELLAETGPNVHPRIHRDRAETFEPDGEYDLLLFCNVLSELDAPVETVERFLPHLAADGTCVLLAPADRNTAIGLRTVERALADDGPLDVFAPTLRLWPGERPTDEGWSFDVREDLEPSGLQERLDGGKRGESDPGERTAATGEFVNRDVQYAYALLRSDGKRRIDAEPSRSRFAPLCEMDRHVTDRIDCLSVKLSRSLSTGRPLYRIGDGSQREDCFAVVTNETSLNRGLREAAYGELLVFESVLVLWNGDEGAYNLVVDDETVVDRAG
ncbi:small ribosomal subunit Rsm22 family protein [Natronorarus salvus]|uniref:small ribosomal subunit Rsm22 family protein n=1 Tax=Natronorarus salvus TaxID=3117733 RepID=UPI002F2685D1